MPNFSRLRGPNIPLQSPCTLFLGGGRGGGGEEGLFGEQNKQTRAIKIRQQNSSLSKSQDVKLKLKSTARSSQTNHNRGQKTISRKANATKAKVTTARAGIWEKACQGQRPQTEALEFKASRLRKFRLLASSLLHRRQVGWSGSR